MHRGQTSHEAPGRRKQIPSPDTKSVSSLVSGLRAERKTANVAKMPLLP